MKTLLKTLTFLIALAITSCTGPMGPPGYDGLDGLDGLDGDSFIGNIFEIQGDFTENNDYLLYYQFPTDFEIYDTDVVLVYILWEVVDDLDVWRLLPQTRVFDEGILQYNYDYTVADVQVFLEGTIDLTTLFEEEWKDQVFRIAVLPADFAKSDKIDVNNLNSILNAPQLELNTIENISFSDISVN